LGAQYSNQWIVLFVLPIFQEAFNVFVINPTQANMFKKQTRLI